VPKEIVGAFDRVRTTDLPITSQTDLVYCNQHRKYT